LSAGFATVFDVILAEDRLTNARLAVAAARIRCGQSIARWAYESGGIVVDPGDTSSDRAARLLGHFAGGIE
jgi:hypothetical protein